MSAARTLRAALMPALALLLLLPGAVPDTGAQEGQASAAARGTVGLQVTRQEYDPVMPWRKYAEQTGHGTAVVVPGRYLATTAEMVRDATLVQVRTFGRYPDYAARVVHRDYQVNLALLRVGDEAFWEELQPLRPAPERPPRGPLAVNRWRANGRFESGSAEIVDVRVASTAYGAMEVPTLRGTTAMSGLGRGEALTQGDTLLGLVTGQSEQALEALPARLLARFVAAHERGEKVTLAHRGFSWQRLNHPHLRTALGLPERGTGVVVREVFAGGSGAGVLQPGDVVHRLAGHAVDPEGQIEHPVYGAISFVALLNDSLEPTLPVEVERDGARRTLALRRSRFGPQDYRVPPPVFDAPVDYEVLGGLVLRELTLGYLRAWGRNWRQDAPTRLVLAYRLNGLRARGQPPGHLLIVSRVLPDRANLGYDDVTNAIVERVNGRPARSLAALREALATPLEGDHVLELLPGQSRGRLVLGASEQAAAERRVRNRYGIPPQ